MVSLAAELPEVPLLYWSRIIWLWKPGCGLEVEGEAVCEWEPETGRSSVENSGSLSQLRERHTFTLDLEPRQKENCLRVFLPNPRTSEEAKPSKCLCLSEASLQTLNRCCLSRCWTGLSLILLLLRWNGSCPWKVSTVDKSSPEQLMGLLFMFCVYVSYPNWTCEVCNFVSCLGHECINSFSHVVCIISHLTKLILTHSYAQEMSHLFQ